MILLNYTKEFKKSRISRIHNTDHSILSVSYTHLDVYKRQEYNLDSQGCTLRGGINLIKWGIT